MCSREKRERRFLKDVNVQIMKSLNTIIRGLDLILTGNKENILSRG